MNYSTIAILSLTAITAVCGLVSVFFHMRGNAKGEAVALEVGKVATDIELAIPAGSAAVIAVVASDLEAEIEKVAPGSSVASVFVRLKAVLKAAGLVAAMLAIVGCTGNAVVRDAIYASNAASKVEGIVAPDLESECVQPMRASDAVGKADLAKKCDPKVAAYAGERRAHLLVNVAIVAAESGGGITVGEMLALVRQLAESVAVLTKEYVK